MGQRVFKQAPALVGATDCNSTCNSDLETSVDNPLVVNVGLKESRQAMEVAFRIDIANYRYQCFRVN